MVEEELDDEEFEEDELDDAEQQDVEAEDVDSGDADVVSSNDEEQPIPVVEDSVRPVQEVESIGSITPADIAVLLTAEVGRFNMTAQKLMELRPGNFLRLDVMPENGLDLTINGKKVGRGELICVGEKLGIRILEVG